MRGWPREQSNEQSVNSAPLNIWNIHQKRKIHWSILLIGKSSRTWANNMGHLALRVTPGAKKDALEFGPPLRVRLTAPPIEGRANAALEEYLGGLSGTAVRVVSGHKSRMKTIAFDCAEDAFLAALRNSQAGKK